MKSLTPTLSAMEAQAERSREFREALEPLFVHSRALIARARQLCLARRRIRGGSDPATPLTDRNGDGAPLAGTVGRREALTQNEAIWRFLEAHRGELFCTQCIASALSATKRIDRSVLAAEGRGARRTYAPCSRCGKDRLLCGLAA